MERKARTKSCTNHCRSCGRHFSSVSAFDAHRQGEYGLPKHSLDGRRCVSPEHIKKPALDLHDVGRIDLRGLSDNLTLDAVHVAKQKHRLTHRNGHEAPIRLRERQAKALAYACGYGAKDEDGNPRDFAAPGSRLFGHELWVEEGT